MASVRMPRAVISGIAVDLTAKLPALSDREWVIKAAGCATGGLDNDNLLLIDPRIAADSSC